MKAYWTPSLIWSAQDMSTALNTIGFGAAVGTRMSRFKRMVDVASGHFEMSQLTTTEMKVLGVLSDSYLDGAYYSRAIAGYAEVSLLAARRAIKSLVRRGYVELQRGLFDDDGMIAGSGYSATQRGHQFYVATLKAAQT